MSVAGRTLPYLSKFSSSSFFRFGGRPRLLPVFPGTFGVFACSPHPLKKTSKTAMKYLPSEGTEAGRTGRRARKSEQLLGTQPKEGLNQSKQQDGEGREEGFPLAGSLLWEPPARHGTRRGADRQECGGAGSIAPTAGSAGATKAAMHAGCLPHNARLPVCLATPGLPALPLARPRSPPTPGTTAVRRSPPSSQPGWLHPDTGGGLL